MNSTDNSDENVIIKNCTIQPTRLGDTGYKGWTMLCDVNIGDDEYYMTATLIQGEKEQLYILEEATSRCKKRITNQIDQILQNRKGGNIDSHNGK